MSENKNAYEGTTNDQLIANRHDLERRIAIARAQKNEALVKALTVRQQAINQTLDAKSMIAAMPYIATMGADPVLYPELNEFVKGNGFVELGLPIPDEAGRLMQALPFGETKETTVVNTVTSTVTNVIDLTEMDDVKKKVIDFLSQKDHDFKGLLLFAKELSEKSPALNGKTIDEVINQVMLNIVINEHSVPEENVLVALIREIVGPMYRDENSAAMLAALRLSLDLGITESGPLCDIINGMICTYTRLFHGSTLPERAPAHEACVNSFVFDPVTVAKNKNVIGYLMQKQLLNENDQFSFVADFLKELAPSYLNGDEILAIQKKKNILYDMSSKIAFAIPDVVKETVKTDPPKAEQEIVTVAPNGATIISGKNKGKNKKRR